MTRGDLHIDRGTVGAFALIFLALATTLFVLALVIHELDEKIAACEADRDTPHE